MGDNFRPNATEEEAYKFDPLLHAVTTVPGPHRMGHDGFMFHSSGKPAAIPNGLTADFLMSVPKGTYPHIQRVELNLSAGDVDLVMYEGVTTSDDGTTLPVFNTKRSSPIVNKALVCGGPTITDLGTQFHLLYVPPTSAGVGNTVGVIDINQGEEWLLTEDIKYAFRITNNSGGALTLSYEFVWYEIGYSE